jgi:dipeptidase D
VFRLIDIKTTNTLNAIPNFCEVIININKSYINKFKKDFSRYFQILLNTYKDSEKNLSLDFNNVKTSLHPLTLNDTSKLMDVVLAVNNGLNNYDVFFKTPRVSTNLGKLVITQNQVHLGWLQRSNDDYDLDKLNNKLISLFNLVGGKYQIANRTSGLKPNNSNRLALQIKNIAQTQFHRQIAIVAVHAVLEMGDIVKHYPKIIPASIGANIQNPHTVNERVEIQSILYTYELLKEIIKHVQ